MHLIEPYYRWLEIYSSETDEQSPFFNVEHSAFEFTDTIYGYCIHPQWDDIDSETLYLKVIYANYESGTLIIELIGEWNDALHNDIMHFKRNLLDYYLLQGFQQFVIIGENVFNFHGSEDDYYDEWFDQVEDGWIVTLGFQEHVIEEMTCFGIDSFFNYGGELEIDDWRSLHPLKLIKKIDEIMKRRIDLT
jgi:hypothetical protein